MKNSTQTSLRFDPELYARVERFAASQSRSIADVVRSACEQYLLGQKLLHDSDLRLRRVCEYGQLALDAILQENHPEFRDPILLEVDKRMERFHGAR
ncbi:MULTISPECIES: hypothetical protein [Sphingomonas]|uniref:hypothetical protein n=1 Tax=Sphingomonas TaxID=13687 RepID=UPI000F2C4CFA|nr:MULTISPECIES: hypothetical protein [unclassified Sphingomonas]